METQKHNKPQKMSTNNQNQSFSTKAQPKQHKTGIPNQGYEYEKLVPAHLALQLLFNEKVRDFSFDVNASSFSKLDDLHIDIEYTDGSKKKFAIQLKHREPGKDKIEAQLELCCKTKKKKNFDIGEYHKAYKKDKAFENYIMILFTNVTFENIENVKDYTVRKASSPLPVESENEEIYQFQRWDFDENFEKNFFLMSVQKNVTDTSKAVTKLFEEKLASDTTTATCFIEFFQRLRNGNYEDTKINRDQVILILSKFLLSSFIIKSSNSEKNTTISLVEETVKTFDLTILSEFKKSDIESKWKWVYLLDPETREELSQLGREYKFLQKSDNLEQHLVEVVYFLKKKLLFLQCKNEFRQIIAAIVPILKTLRKEKLSLVLVDKNMQIKCPQTCKVFRNLEDLRENEELYKKMSKFQISFQGREATSIECLRNYGLKLDSIITPDDVFSFLEGDLMVGTKMEDGPKILIPMTLLRSNFHINRLKNVCKQKTTVVHCGGKSEELFQLLKKEDFKCDIVRSEKESLQYDNTLLVLTDDPKITNSSFHHLELTDGEFLKWMEKSVNPKDVSVTQDNLNLISGKPGSGKTTIMKIMANNCSLDYWTQFIPLQKISATLSELSKCEVEELVQKLVGIESDNRRYDSFCRYFLNEKRVIFMFDGLNELNQSAFGDAQTLIKKISKAGYKVWISCTIELEKQIQKTFEIPYYYTVKDVEAKDQKEYIRKRLEDVGDDMVEKIIEKLPHHEILKAPLILYILTETIRNNKEQKLQLNLSQLYGNFIEMKMMHVIKKVEFSSLEPLKWLIEEFKYYYFKQYQIAALQTCLEKDLFRKLGVKVDKRFIQEIKKDDQLGLLKIGKNNTFAFIHHTFAEYLTAMWIIDNFEEIPVTDRSFIFTSKYSGIRKFFDYELARDHDLHLAVLDQDLIRVQELAHDHETKDKAGRTALHLAVSLGKKMEKKQKYARHSNDDTEDQKKILDLLLSKGGNIYDKDEYFKWNLFEYADASSCLFSLEELSKRETLHWSDVPQLSKNLKNWSYQCVKSGCINLLKNIVKEKGFLELNDLHDKPLLFTAIKNHQNEIAMYLFKHGHSFSKVDFQKKTALHIAATCGNLKMVEILVESCSVEARDATGGTPLHHAAKMGHLPIVKLLVQKGAPIEAENREYKTPLHKAANTGKDEVVAFLLERGANIAAVTSNGRTSLHRAAEAGHVKTIKILIEHGINKDAKDNFGRTALLYAIYEGSEDIVKYLLEQGVDVLATNDEGRTPREIAEEQNFKKIAEILKKAEEQSLSRSTSDDLWMATKDLDAFKNFLENGHTVDDVNKNGDTPLHVAAAKGHLEVVRFLLRNNASPARENKDHRVPLHIACQWGHLDVVKELLNREQNSAKDRLGMTPLHWAAHRNHLQVVEILADHKENLDNTVHTGRTPLHSAAHYGHNEMIKCLFSKGADIMKKNKKGQTCLHVAVERQRCDTVKYLLSQELLQKENVDWKTLSEQLIHEKDVDGKTVLHLAAGRKNKDIVVTLLENGADINAKNNYGQTALDVAIAAGREEIIEFLENFGEN